MENLENQIPEQSEQQNIPEYIAPTTQEQVSETVEQSVAQISDEDSFVQPAEPAKKTRKEKRAARRGRSFAVFAALTAVLVAAGCLLTMFTVDYKWEKRFETLQQEMDKKLVANNRLPSSDNNSNDGDDKVPVQPVTDLMTPAQVYYDNVDTVVMILCEVQQEQGGQIAVGTSSGSGFIVTEDGYVVTNSHVVNGATKISVTTSDGTEYPAQLIGADSVNDVAVLKIAGSGLDYAVIGKSSDLVVGDQVVAIGNPLGELTSTLTVGYISAKERDVNSSGNTINMLQTDAAINSGNSGGPLFNMMGEVVGITTAKYSGTTESGAVIEGIGFAIPVDDVYDLLSDLMNYGYVTGAYLGVSVSDMDVAAAEYYGMPVGAYVHEAVAGYCAAAAGLQEKDIIVALGEYEVGSVSDLTKALRKFEAGDTTTITVYRSGQELVLNITLDAKPQTDTSQTPEFPEDTPDGNFDEWYEYFAPFFGFGG